MAWTSPPWGDRPSVQFGWEQKLYNVVKVCAGRASAVVAHTAKTAYALFPALGLRNALSIRIAMLLFHTIFHLELLGRKYNTPTRGIRSVPVSSYLVLVTDTQREGGMALTMMQGPKAGLGGLAGLSRASSSPQVAMAPVRPGEYAEPKPFSVLRRSRRGCGTLLRAARIGGCGSRGAIFAPPAPAGTGWGYDRANRDTPAVSRIIQDPATALFQ